MPTRKKSSQMKRKKPTPKHQNQAQLQFFEGNNDHSDVATASHSRHSEDLDSDGSDIIESSQPNAKRTFRRSSDNESYLDKQLKEAGMFEDGMTETQKEDFLAAINESLKMAGDNAENSDDASEDLFSNHSPHPKKNNLDTIEELESIIIKKQNMKQFMDSDDDDFMIPGTVEKKERRNKPKNIFTLMSRTRKENSVHKSEKTNDEKLLAIYEEKKTVAKTDTNVSECKKNRTVLLRPSSTARKQIEKDREVSSMNHIPLYAPADMPPRNYTQVIREYFDNYLESLSQIQQLPPRCVSWDNPVIVGRHNKNTIDALRPGQRVRDMEMWYRTAVNGSRSDVDGSEVNAKKPRLDSEDSSPMTIDDDEECDKEDDGKNENNNDILYSYLNTEEPDFHFDPEKSQRSYSRNEARSSTEDPVYIDVPPDDSPQDNLDTPGVFPSPTKKKVGHNQKSSQEEEEKPNVNQSSQSIVKKIMGYTRKESSSSLLSGKKKRQKKGK